MGKFENIIQARYRLCENLLEEQQQLDFNKMDPVLRQNLMNWGKGASPLGQNELRFLSQNNLTPETALPQVQRALANAGTAGTTGTNNATATAPATTAETTAATTAASPEAAPAPAATQATTPAQQQTAVNPEAAPAPAATAATTPTSQQAQAQTNQQTSAMTPEQKRRANVGIQQQ